MKVIVTSETDDPIMKKLAENFNNADLNFNMLLDPDAKLATHNITMARLNGETYLSATQDQLAPNNVLGVNIEENPRNNNLNDIIYINIDRMYLRTEGQNNVNILHESLHGMSIMKDTREIALAYVSWSQFDPNQKEAMKAFADEFLVRNYLNSVGTVNPSFKYDNPVISIGSLFNTQYGTYLDAVTGKYVPFDDNMRTAIIKNLTDADVPLYSYNKKIYKTVDGKAVETTEKPTQYLKASPNDSSNEGSRYNIDSNIDQDSIDNNDKSGDQFSSYWSNKNDDAWARIESRYSSGSKSSGYTDPWANLKNSWGDQSSITFSFSFPVIIDLDKDGIETKFDKTVFFDMDNDGFLEQTNWVHKDDGFLIYDLGGDKKITSAKELAFGQWTSANDTDLQALATAKDADGKRRFDVNGDGKLNSADGSVWTGFKVWQDKNTDGIMNDGEMLTLASLGITEINLKYANGTNYNDKNDDRSAFGNTLHGTANYKRNGAYFSGVGDVSLEYNKLGYKKVAIDGGYEYQFETGKNLRVAQMGETMAILNMTLGAYDIADGNILANTINAGGSSRNVHINGGANHDVLIGGDGDDMISGDSGQDRIYGNAGDDLLIIDRDDMSAIIRGGSGMDTLMVGADVSIGLILKNLEAEVAIGAGGNDTLYADNNDIKIYEDVQLYGKDGNDILSDGEGDDLLSGDNGNDNLYAGVGDDGLFGGSGYDLMFGSHGDDALYGGYANDTLYGGDGDDYLSAGTGHDVMYGGSSDDRLFGGGGNDSMMSGESDDTLGGGYGNDVLSFWRGDDELWGDAGDDLFRLEKDGDLGHVGWSVLFGGTGMDTLQLVGGRAEWTWRYITGNQFQLYRNTSPAEERIVIDTVDIERLRFADGTGWTLGNSGLDDTSDNYMRRSWAGPVVGDDDTSSITDTWMGNDTIDNSYYNNKFIEGGTGEDVIEGGAASSTLYGGAGQDTIDAGRGNDTVSAKSGEDVIDGGYGNDTIYSGTGSDIVKGGEGKDYIKGSSGSDTLVGDADADIIYGESGADVIGGGTGNDTLYGNAGYDKLYGDEGDDYLSGGAGSDYLYGGAGNDTLYGDIQNGYGFNYMSGGEGNDSLYGGNMDDQLSGDAGRDRLYGGIGHDVLMGGAGGDYLDGGADLTDVVSYETSAEGVRIHLGLNTASGGDAEGDTITHFEQIIGSKNGDRLVGSAGDNVLAGGDAFDDLFGGAGDDDLYGGTGGDDIIGDDGMDRLYGGAGNDVINGGMGADTITGGAGADKFIFSWYKATSTVGRDIILDFEAGIDDLDFSMMDANNDATGNQKFGFSGTTAKSYSIWMEDKGYHLLIKGDLTGDTNADFEVLLKNENYLKSGDFLL